MDKTTYYYMGSESQVGDLALGKFGQQVPMTDAEALNALDGGAALHPAEDWPFTEDEVNKYPHPAFRDNAPEDFKAKFRAACVNVGVRRAKLKAAQNGAAK